MQRYLFVFTMLLFCLIAKAQQAQPCSHIVAKGDNILYIGVDNVITLNSTAKADSFTTTKGRVEEQSGTSCFVMVDSSAGSPCSIKAWSKGKVLAEKEYRIRYIPLTPTPMVLGKKSGSTLPAVHMKVTPGINLVLENSDFDIRFPVKEFTLERIANDGIRETNTNAGPAFTTGSKALIEKAKSGDIFIFSGITTTMPGKKDIVLPPMIIRVTE